jgi:hypothetical protein
MSEKPNRGLIYMSSFTHSPISHYDLLPIEITIAIHSLPTLPSTSSLKLACWSRHVQEVGYSDGYDMITLKSFVHHIERHSARIARAWRQSTSHHRHPSAAKLSLTLFPPPHFYYDIQIQQVRRCGLEYCYQEQSSTRNTFEAIRANAIISTTSWSFNFWWSRCWACYVAWDAVA